ncbi:MAG TPA: M48 family metallopeptidase [Bryobacteraceae bacterium]|nr:M48 family metallopeptidase [Bryobacteraceae bacterium]
MLARLLVLTALFCVLLAAAPTLHIPAAAQAGPTFNAEAATRAYLATYPPDKKARSDSYFEGGYWLIFWDFLYGAAIAIVLLTTRVSARMRDLAERVTRFRPLQTWLYWLQYAIVIFVLGFPLTVYEGFFRERQYGLMNQTLAAWFGDQAKSLAISVVLGGLLIMALFGIVRRLPNTWHVWGAIAMIVFTALVQLIAPVFLAPMFNKYTPLEDKAIRESILRLARQNGIPATNVWQVDASRQSNRISANVSGFLGTERITLNDNLLRRCSPEAIEAVMGHEMGHYVLNHVYKGLAFMTIIIVVSFAFLRWALNRSMSRWGTRWGIRGLGDTAVLPLAALILSLIFFVLTPVTNTLSRTDEYEADIFGLNTSRQPDGFAEAALLLGEYRKLEPGPIEEMIFFDHPSGHTRIYSAMRWKAENLR